jgi:hypothetical protein
VQDRRQRVPALVGIALVLPLLGLRQELGAQSYTARDSGPARFSVVAEKPGHVLVQSGGRVVGFGELVPLSRGAAGPLMEFRGYVKKGRISLSAPRAEPGRAQVRRVERGRAIAGSQSAVPGVCVGASTQQLERKEGSLCTRWRLASRVQDLRIRGDAYVWPSGERELRLELEFVEGGEALPASVPVRWGASPLHLLQESLLTRGSAHRPESELGPALREISIAPLALRPGDRHYLTLLSMPGDPGARVWPAEELRERLGYGMPRRSRRDSAKLRQLAVRLRELIAKLPAQEDPLDRGDHRRPTSDDQIWTHGEFDLGLGLELFAQLSEDEALAQRARAAVLHLLGRDMAPASAPGHVGLRLPAVHGAEHGRGRVAAGHVFLEGALLHALARADRLLLDRVHQALSDLAGLAGERAGSAWHLRDVAWPLRQLCVGLLYASGPRWRRTAELLLRVLGERYDDAVHAFDFDASREGDELQLELWLISGLVLPALDRAAELELTGASALRSRLLRAIAGLPKTGGGLATHYRSTLRSGLLPASGQGRNAACAAWLIEGLRPSLPGRGSRYDSRVQRIERQLLRELPSGQWDPATEAALLLRLRWLRPGLRALR